MLQEMRINLKGKHMNKYVVNRGGNKSSGYNNDIIDTGSLADDRKMATNFEKFRLLMWKNFLIQHRHPYQTLLEMIVPVFFSIILIGLRSLVVPKIVSNNTFYESFDINTLQPLRWVNVIEWRKWSIKISTVNYWQWAKVDRIPYQRVEISIFATKLNTKWFGGCSRRIIKTRWTRWSE